MQDTAPEFAHMIGKIETLEPNVRRILAPNASPMTYWGTNTYIVGTGEVAVIDPGPKDMAHLFAILDGIGADETITHIIVTHSHVDHSPLARDLSQATGAPIYAFGDSQAGRSAVMQQLASHGIGGGEGVDHDFAPDHLVADGDEICGATWALRAIHTPGHFGNHLCFAMGDLCFVGDHVMGWASSLVSAPDGDLTDFMASCHRLNARDWRVFHAGHGAPITAPNARLNWLISHRLTREAQILEALGDGAMTPAALTRKIYHDTPEALLPAAARNVFAHLVDLLGKSRVRHAGALSVGAEFALLQKN